MSPLAVVIPTYRRPGSLIATLDSVRAQESGVPFVIVVADNDAAAQDGLNAARAWAAEHGLADRVILLPVAERGISHNRNAGLAAALAHDPAIEAVAMIDDDALAEPGWLAALADAQARFDADVVCGPSLYELPEDAPQWARDANPFQTTERPSGLVTEQRSMCNAMLTRRLAAHFGTVFDPAFGLSGGEDIELFARCNRDGRRMAWAADAVVREPIGPQRITRDWLLRRARSAGHILARIAIKHRGRARAVPQQLVLGIRTILSGQFRWLFGTSRSIRFDGRSRIRVGLGRIAGLLQPPSIEY